MGFYGTTRIRLTRKVDGQSVVDRTTLGVLTEGRVLRVAGEPRLDEFKRQTFGVPVEITPGRDKWIASAEPELHDLIKSLAPGDVVNVKGPEMHRTNRFGRITSTWVRATEITVVKKAETAPAPEPSAPAA